MDDFFSCLDDSIDINRPGFYVFFTDISTGVLSFLHDDFNFEILLRKLTLKEQADILLINDFNRRVKSLVSKLFVRVVLNFFISKYDEHAVDGDIWRDVSFQYNRYGKPTLGQGFAFSISTSDHIISISIQTSSPEDMGIDLSHVHQDSISSKDFMEQFRPIFAPSEASNLNSIKDDSGRYIAFNQIWTLKEAFTKLLGTGLNIDLSSFFFDVKSPIVTIKGPLLESRKLVNDVYMSWNEDIIIDISKLEMSKLKDIPSLDPGKLFCYSGVLVQGDEKTLPVIVSLVTQHRFGKPKSFHIDFEKLLVSAETNEVTHH